MQEEFEKKVRERVHSFGMQPSPQAWDEIDAVLGKKKHRRVFIGWWILVGLLIAGGGVFLYEKDDILRDGLNRQPAVNTDTTQNNLAKQAPAATLPAPATQQPVNKKQAEAAANKQQPQNNTTKNNTPLSKSNNNTITYQAPAAVKQQPPVTEKDNAPLNKQEIAQASTQPIEPQSTIVNDQPLANHEETNAATEKEPAALLPEVNNETVKEDSQQVKENTLPNPVANTQPTNIQPPKPGDNMIPKTIVTARHQWFLKFSAGALQTKQRGVFSGSDKNFAANVGNPNGINNGYDNNIVALTSPAALKYDIAAPGKGFTITAGAMYQYKASNRWRLFGGVQAAYLSNTQKTGSLYTEAFNLNTGQLTQSFSTDKDVQTSYYAGNGNIVNKSINKAWQLQVMGGAGYVFNPRAKIKFSVEGSFAFAHMLSSQWLIPDARYGKLYYNKEVLNNSIISWQAGPALEFKNQLRLGINYQQSFTLLAKDYVTPQLHWQNLHIYTAIPFTIKTKKAKH